MAAAVLCPGAEAPSKVTAVRFWSLGDVTRVAIEVSAEFQYKSDRIANPDRLFFDIQGAKPIMVGKGTHIIAVGDSILKQIRVAETYPGVTRVVLDLDQNAEYTASQLSSPARLMIELRSKDKPAPPSTASVTGAKKLVDATEQPSEADIAIPVVAPAPVAPPPAASAVIAKPEPKKFQLPPYRAEPARLDIKQQEPLAQPSTALLAKTSKVVPPGPPVAMARAGRIPPPPDPAKTAPPPVRSDPVREAMPAKRTTSSLTRVLGLKLGRVVIDPGHGGYDVGTHGPSGILEKDVVLDVAKRLGALLEDGLGSEVIFTRDDDTFIALEDRTKIANDHKADLFLSIHANSSPYRTAAGVETYYLNFTTSRAALDVATRENASSEKSVFDLKELLQKIALKDKIDESREFASRIEASLYGISSKSNPNAKNRGVKKAPFVVLIGASMPSVLAEIGFLTNPSDESALKKPEHRQKIAEALFKGISSYANTLSHFQVAKRD